MSIDQLNVLKNIYYADTQSVKIITCLNPSRELMDSDIFLTLMLIIV